ncbi:hypothetical protein [Flavobacterium sp.]|uniref:hypothetical protein n=1 Tax=Flavobacterium sp. TaxID=239 RepID=UPI002FDEA050
MKKIPLLSFLLFASYSIYSQTQGVGINEDNPQQTLHLGSSNSTIRVDGLNEINNTYNLGSNNTYPLYVDHNGSLTLYNAASYNSNGLDFLNNNNINSTIIIPEGDNDGVESAEIFNFEVTVNRPSLVLVKYNLSFEVFEDQTEKKLTDNLARRVNTYFKLNSGTRKYSHASKCYTGSSLNDVAGILYNMSSSYIYIPTAGTHTIRMFAEVSSGLTSNIPNTGKATCLIVGRGYDSLMYIIN